MLPSRNVQGKAPPTQLSGPESTRDGVQPLPPQPHLSRLGAIPDASGSASDAVRIHATAAGWIADASGAIEPEVTHHETGTLEPETIAVLRAVPELTPRVLALADAADDDPGACAVLEALAEMVADLLEPMERLQPALLRCLDAVEQVASLSPDAEDLVAWAFLDALDPTARRGLAPWFGPRTAALAAQVDERGPSSS